MQNRNVTEELWNLLDDLAKLTSAPPSDKKCTPLYVELMKLRGGLLCNLAGLEKIENRASPPSPAKGIMSDQSH